MVEKPCYRCRYQLEPEFWFPNEDVTRDIKAAAGSGEVDVNDILDILHEAMSSEPARRLQMSVAEAVAREAGRYGGQRAADMRALCIMFAYAACSGYDGDQVCGYRESACACTPATDEELADAAGVDAETARAWISEATASGFVVKLGDGADLLGAITWRTIAPLAEYATIPFYDDVC